MIILVTSSSLTNDKRYNQNELIQLIQDLVISKLNQEYKPYEEVSDDVALVKLNGQRCFK